VERAPPKFAWQSALNFGRWLALNQANLGLNVDFDGRFGFAIHSRDRARSTRPSGQRGAGGLWPAHAIPNLPRLEQCCSLTPGSSARVCLAKAQRSRSGSCARRPQIARPGHSVLAAITEPGVHPLFEATAPTGPPRYTLASPSRGGQGYAAYPVVGPLPDVPLMSNSPNASRRIGLGSARTPGVLPACVTVRSFAPQGYFRYMLPAARGIFPHSTSLGKRWPSELQKAVSFAASHTVDRLICAIVMCGVALRVRVRRRACRRLASRTRRRPRR